MRQSRDNEDEPIQIGGESGLKALYCKMLHDVDRLMRITRGLKVEEIYARLGRHSVLQDGNDIKLYQMRGRSLIIWVQ